MRVFIQLKLFLLLIVSAQSVYAVTPLDEEFMKFFNTKYVVALYESDKVIVTVDRADNLTVREIPVDLEFQLKAVEKVLVLKIPESGYDNEGRFYKGCLGDNIFVAGYKFDPTINVTQLKLRMRTRCGSAPIRLLIWVRTSDGKYYLGTKTFHAYVGIYNSDGSIFGEVD